MKIFDKYFKPYAEYCIRTALSEDELKEVLAKECPATSDVLSWKAFKAAFGLRKTIVFFCDPDDPLCLHPLKAYRNTSRGDLFIRCEKTSGTETILHISIAQNIKYKWSLYGICIFALGDCGSVCYLVGNISRSSFYRTCVYRFGKLSRDGDG